MREILRQILRRATGDDETFEPSLAVLREAWPGLVGDELAAVTRPCGVDWDRGRLTLEVASETWRDELARHEHRLLARIGGVLPWEIDALEFRVGMHDAETRCPDDAPREERSGETAGRSPGGDLEPDEPFDDDVESSLDSLDDDTADAARRILDHVRDS